MTKETQLSRFEENEEKLKLYHQVRKYMKPGDVIAFSGKEFISNAIKFFTGSSVSHVGVVMETKLADSEGNAKKGRVVQVIESTSLDGFAGVSVNRLSDRILKYNGGLWWLPLSEDARARLDEEVFFNFLLRQKGIEYDFRGVREFIWRKIPLVNKLFQTESFEKWFCSELVSAALEESGVLGSINASKVSPQDLVEFKIYETARVISPDTKTPLKNLNTREPFF